MQKIIQYSWKIVLPEYKVTEYYMGGHNYVAVLLTPLVSGWAGGQREKVCPGCISETVRCWKFILGRDIG